METTDFKLKWIALVELWINLQQKAMAWKPIEATKLRDFVELVREYKNEANNITMRIHNYIKENKKLKLQIETERELSDQYLKRINQKANKVIEQNTRPWWITFI